MPSIVCLLLLRARTKEVSEFDWEREDNRGALLSGDIEERAEKAQLHGLWAPGEDLTCLQ